MELMVFGVLISAVVVVPIGRAIYRGNRRWLVAGRREGRRATRMAIVALSVMEQAIVNLLGFGLLYYAFWPETGSDLAQARGLWWLLVMLYGVPLALVSTGMNMVLFSVFVSRRHWD